MDLGIKGNSAIVTASSSGLGKAAAASLLKEGVNVLINGRDEDKLILTAEELGKIGGGRVEYIKAKKKKKEDVEALVHKAVNTFGGIDHLVTSAGGPPAAPFVETSEKDWYYAFDLLVMSVVRLVRLALPDLKKDGGTIVNITSISVKESIEGLVLSNSVRMSVIGLMKTLSKELAPEVRVNAVLPGYHETERVKNLFEKQVERGIFKSYAGALEDKSESIPLKKIGDPEGLGDFITFLSSPKSNYINGSAVVVDGGESSSNL